MNFQERARIRAYAEDARKRASRAQHPVSRHLLLLAAARYDDAAVLVIRAEKAVADAGRYERDPGDDITGTSG